MMNRIVILFAFLFGVAIYCSYISFRMKDDNHLSYIILHILPDKFSKFGIDTQSLTYIIEIFKKEVVNLRHLLDVFK
jgi:hypothetical protein